jgi:hypothetical protein
LHISPRHARRAWGEILAAWHAAGASAPLPRATAAQTLYLRSRLPERRRLWGFEQRRQQPSGRLGDGTTMAIY